MKLDTRHAAHCIGVPVDTIERWARQGKVPARRRESQWVFDAAELREWARSSGLPFDMEPEPVDTTNLVTTISVVHALGRGGLHDAVEATTVDQVLQAVAGLAPVPDDGRDELLRRLKEREELSSTGIGHGVAVPHPREPLHELVDQPSITGCFLKSPLDFGAIDGRPVRCALLLLSPDVQSHLKLLSRVAFCLNDEAVAALIADDNRSLEEFERQLARVEARIRS